jgi:hypothetical protein
MFSTMYLLYTDNVIDLSLHKVVEIWIIRIRKGFENLVRGTIVILQKFIVDIRNIINIDPLTVNILRETLRCNALNVIQ